MRYPERGSLRITGTSGEHPSASPSGIRITGVISAPGVPATNVEHHADATDRLAGVQELPVLVDRADPTRFTILWDEIQPASWRDPQAQAAQGDPGIGAPAAMGPGGQPIAPQPAARSETGLGRMFGQGGAGMLGQMISQAVGDALSEATEGSVRRATEEALGPFGGKRLGRVAGRTAGRLLGAAGDVAFGQRGGTYGVPGGQPGSGQPGGPAFNQPGSQPAAPPPPPAGGAPFGGASAFPQVSWSDERQSPAGQVSPLGQVPTIGQAPAVGQPAPRPAGSGPAGPAEFFASGAGEHASAVVTAVQDVPPDQGFVPPGGVADLTLEITRADGSVYIAPARLSFATPERRAAIATPGTRLTVRVDPSLPTRVAIVS